MKCGLHFTVHTWYPELHVGTTLYCPECGQHEEQFVTWVAEVEGFIFQHVPGDAELDTLGGQPLPKGEYIVEWDDGKGNDPHLGGGNE